MLGSRPIDTLTGAAIGGTEVRLALLVFADFENDPAYMWTGIGNLQWGGQEWVGVADLLGLSEVEETADTASKSLRVQLSGVELSGKPFVPSMLGNYQGREARVFLAFLDEDFVALVGEPLLVFDGLMDSDEIGLSDDAVTVAIRIVRRDSDQLRPRPLRYTHEDQRLIYPDADDRGLESVPLMQNNNLQWGVS